MSYTRFRERRRYLSTGITNAEKVAGTYNVGNYVHYVNNLKTGQTPHPYGTSWAPGLVVEKCWDQVNPGPPYRSGGNFAKILIEYPRFGIVGKGCYSGKPGAVVPGTYTDYEGGFTDPSFSGDPYGNTNFYVNAAFSPADTSHFPSLTSLAPTAFVKTMPSISEANVSQFLYEFREVPRMLKTTAEGFHETWKSLGGNVNVPQMPKKASEQFLNVQFGWLPFVKDLSDINRVWHLSAHYMSQKIRDNNKWIRRRRVLETTEQSRLVRRNLGVTGCYPPGNFQLDKVCTPKTVDGSSVRYYNDIYEDINSQIWSEGSFKYYRPEFDDSLFDHHSSLSKVNRYLTLYGARINPSVVWKVTPWSWLIDWFSNVGDNIEAATAIGLDGMTARYLFIMQLRSVVIRQTTHINFASGPLSLSWSRRRVTKQRYASDSPYGFGLSWGNLGPKRLSILAALGITRVL